MMTVTDAWEHYISEEPYYIFNIFYAFCILQNAFMHFKILYIRGTISNRCVEAIQITSDTDHSTENCNNCAMINLFQLHGSLNSNNKQTTDKNNIE